MNYNINESIQTFKMELKKIMDELSQGEYNQRVETGLHEQVWRKVTGGGFPVKSEYRIRINDAINQAKHLKGWR